MLIEDAALALVVSALAERTSLAAIDARLETLEKVGFGAFATGFGVRFGLPHTLDFSFGTKTSKSELKSGK